MTASAETQLLPCPFCGGTPSMRSGGPGCHFIQCDTCNAASDDHSQERATTAWNLRAASLAQEQVATATPTVEPLGAPITRPLRDDGAPEWQQINALFERFRLPPPPVPLRDELVIILAWARYGEALHAVTADDRTALLARIAELEKALTALAEGNLGSDPWQANYARVKEFANAALAGAQSSPEGEWIEWAGGECPLDDGVMHQRRYRDGIVGAMTNGRRAGRHHWQHEGGNADIIAYRIAGAQS